MDLAAKLGIHFPAVVRQRGQNYFRRGRVTIEEDEPGRLSATVLGASPYSVAVVRDEDGRFGFACDCPAAERETLCKHMWALLLAADSFGTKFVRGRPPARQAPRPARSGTGAPAGPQATPRAPAREWQEVLELMPRANGRHSLPWPGPPQEADARLLFALDRGRTLQTGCIALRILYQPRRKSGEWGELRTIGVVTALQRQRLAEVDRSILATLHGARRPGYTLQRDYGGVLSDCYELDPVMAELLLPRLCATGRFHSWSEGVLSSKQLSWDDGPPWEFGLRLRREPRAVQVEGFLERAGQRMELAEPQLLLDSGLLATRSDVARFDSRGAWPWVLYLRKHGSLRAPISDEQDLIQGLLQAPGDPRLDIPGLEEPRPVAPRPALFVHDLPGNGRKPRLECRIDFLYEGARVHAADTRRLVSAPGSLGRMLRDLPAEQAALQSFLACGGRPASSPRAEIDGEIDAERFPEMVRQMLAEGWLIEAAGHPLHVPGELQISVRSGIDWFDLEGGIDFDGEHVPLPALLEAAARGATIVRLGDGSVGLMPERWLADLGLLAAGRAHDDALRFDRNQGWLLDAALAAVPGVDADAGFAELRERLARLQDPRPLAEPQGFSGELRPYQRAGLGWLDYLRQAGVGGCLADDMGLGKTVQVLALLQARCQEPGPRLPSLVVAPRSVVFNWLQEAAHFAPQLRVLDYSGPRRKERFGEMDAADLIVTTYGTLRRDALAFRERAFDSVILDEAQAIKNAHSQSAKAARLLKAEQRLALTGTPIENHLGELWSLFEFLNPGMLGRSGAFEELAGQGNGRARDTAGLERFSRALQPFFLRRRKEQVLPDLPPKSEQVLLCELQGRQQRDYESIRKHYRASLLQRADEQGLGKVKIHVLEALLRLRQAACHPGLIDPERRQEGSAKLEALLPHLQEICESGHKALVFSQFTRWLGIVRDRLEAAGLNYEYLDGRTRDRKAKVERFQQDPECRVFLISLKAGGLGLNLTAADYVFLLDPWWNPAVEQQAIDRTHRIGQTRKVMAYRLICRGTVEEKVLELQQSKRELAEAVLGRETDVLRRLTREDLELLLS